MRTEKGVAVASVLALLCLLAGTSAFANGQQEAASSGPTVKIGNLTSVTGAFAFFGGTMKRGIEDAAAEINAAGGVLGARLQVVTVDDGSDKVQGTEVVKKLASAKDIMVIGNMSSLVLIATAPLYEEYRVPVVSLGSATQWTSTPYKGEFNKYTFRMSTVAEQVLPTMFEKLQAKLKFKSIAIIFDAKNDFCVGAKNFCVDAMGKMGIPITDIESAMTNDTDFKAQITKMMPGKPDVVFADFTINERALFARQARDLGWNVQLIAPNMIDPQEFTLSNGAVEGMIGLGNWDPTEDRPLTKAYTAAFQAKHNGEDPNQYDALGRDFVYVVADALKRAGTTTDREAFRNALGQTKNFEGVCGFYTWNDKGDNVTPLAHFVTLDKQGRIVGWK